MFQLPDPVYCLFSFLLTVGKSGISLVRAALTFGRILPWPLVKFRSHLGFLFTNTSHQPQNSRLHHLQCTPICIIWKGSIEGNLKILSSLRLNVYEVLHNVCHRFHYLPCAGASSWQLASIECDPASIYLNALPGADALECIADHRYWSDFNPDIGQEGKILWQNCSQSQILAPVSSSNIAQERRNQPVSTINIMKVYLL